jgi:predicted acylesterase/phospholipase RssA
MEYLILGPASMGMFALLGCLTKHEDELQNIKEISGSSSGAILAVALSLNMSLPDILDKLLTVDFNKITRFNLLNFTSTYGVIDFKLGREALVDLYGGDPTFSELHKKLYISSYCLNRARTEYFSVDTHPDMKVIDAVCMSIAIPILISTVKFNDMIYMDGCMKEVIPVTPFLDKKPDKIMCIQLKSPFIHIQKINNLKQFMTAMLYSLLQLPNTNTIKLGSVREIDTGDIDIYKFSMSYEDKIRMFILGFDT